MQEAAQEAMRSRFPENPAHEQYEAGDLVLVKRVVRGVGQKLDRRQAGPFRVHRRPYPNQPVYELERQGVRETTHFNGDQLLPYRQLDDGYWPTTMPEHATLTSMTARRGPWKVIRCDWSTVPPMYHVLFRNGGQVKVCHEDELAGSWASEDEVPRAFKRCLNEVGFDRLRHENLPEADDSRFDAYRDHWELMTDCQEGALAPQYEVRGNSGHARGTLVLTAECRRRLNFLRGLSAEETDDAEDEEDQTTDDVAGDADGAYDPRLERERVMEELRQRGLRLADEIYDELEEESEDEDSPDGTRGEDPPRDPASPRAIGGREGADEVSEEEPDDEDSPDKTLGERTPRNPASPGAVGGREEEFRTGGDRPPSEQEQGEGDQAEEVPEPQDVLEQDVPEQAAEDAESDSESEEAEAQRGPTLRPRPTPAPERLTYSSEDTSKIYAVIHSILTQLTLN